MRCPLKILIAAAAATVCHTNVQAIVPEASKDQYQGIQERNVFGLRPPETQPQPTNTAAPLPKITLTGITTILDNKRALMRVAPAGKQDATKELSLILTEGQREGDVEVLQIDEKAGSVKVNNSGTIMVLTFEKDGAKLPSTAPMPGGASVPPPLPGVQSTNPLVVPARNPRAVPGRAPRYGTPPVPGMTGNSGVAAAPVGGVPSATGTVPGSTQTTTPAPQDLTAEEQAIVLELQRSAGMNNSALLPPTPLTPSPTAPQQNEPTSTVTPANPTIPGRPTVLVPQ